MKAVTDINHIQVSVIISTYNRYSALINAINSVQQQTHENIELIVVNDNSESEDYINRDLEFDNLKWIDLEISSREKFGFPCPGYVRNIGIAHASGEYIAFLDDDDVWMPQKTYTQITAMIKSECEISCTEGLIGDGFYDRNITYPLYFAEFHKAFCKKYFTIKYGRWDGMLPEVFDLDLIQQHNFIIHSSVVIKKSLLDKAGHFNESPVAVGMEDWDLWKRILEHTNCLNINQPLIYYDGRLSSRQFHKRVLRAISRIFYP